MKLATPAASAATSVSAVTAAVAARAPRALSTLWWPVTASCTVSGPWGVSTSISAPRAPLRSSRSAHWASSTAP